jgi:hypothetical protein
MKNNNRKLITKANIRQRKKTKKFFTFLLLGALVLFGDAFIYYVRKK